MATKYLARTVIEGGRDHHNKFSRRQSNRVVRRATRVYLHQAIFDEELAEVQPAPKREPVPRWHHDRLAAAERWLQSHLGQPWDEVRAEISRRFDVRTLAGRRIVYDHLLRSVCEGDTQQPGHYDFRVNQDGLLQRGPRHFERVRWRQLRKLPPGKVRRLSWDVDAWSRGRKIGRHGAFLFWYEATAPIRTSVPPFYRQTRKLSAEEIAYWDTLTEDHQARLAGQA